MNLKTFKPKTPSLRNLVRLNLKSLANKPYLKKKIKGLKQNSGKNVNGRITSYHRGGGHKTKYRQINFERNKQDIGIVISIEHDPYRSANIAAIYSKISQKYYYIIAPKNLNIGDVINSGNTAKPKNGNSLPISKIPVGCLIHNIALHKDSKSTISRAAGTFSQLIEKTSNYGKIKLSSGKYMTLTVNCFATIGIVSNELLLLTTLGKAGRTRWLNKRPTVRGVAMNPVDHPHGGGEGKTSGGRTSVSPWGKPTKGGKTSTSKKRLKIKN